MNDSELIFVKERLERCEARMQTKKSVEVDRGVASATFRLRNRDAGAHTVVALLAKGHNDVQPVGGPALEKHDELLFVGHGRRGYRALQKRGHSALTHHGHAALLQKIPPREFQSAHAFTTCVAHENLSRPWLVTRDC